MSKTTEVARFSNTGKTFFFNVGQAKNGADFLSINTLYGQGNQERLILFNSHLLEFRKNLEKAITGLTGATFAPLPTESAPIGPALLPERCKCGVSYHEYRVSYIGQELGVFCSKCGETIQ